MRVETAREGTYGRPRPHKGEGSGSRARAPAGSFYCDHRADSGPFDIIGDVHGCLEELLALLDRLGYAPAGQIALPRRAEGTVVHLPVRRHPAARKVVFLGDLVDRGPGVAGVLRLSMGMARAGTALCLLGNHDAKLLKALQGRHIKVAHGLEISLGQLEREPAAFRAAVADFLAGLPSHYILDGGRLVVAHAGLREDLQGVCSSRARGFALYGQTTGEIDEYGLPVRLDWAQEYRGRAMVVYGHTPVHEPVWTNQTIDIDTGCVFGGALTALRYPELELVQEPARRVYYESARPLQPVGVVGP